jgi:undecaprenyl diphosphate synthase
MDKTKLPQHIAIIMDGNRRWAKKKGLPAVAGHKYVAEQGLEKIINAAKDLGIKYITLWAFSTENWDRSEQEVKAIMKLFHWGFSVMGKQLIKKGAKVRFIGDLTKFNQPLQRLMKNLTEKSQDNSAINVVFAVNYGGRDEILRTVKKIVTNVEAGRIDSTDLNEEYFTNQLDTKDIPEPDLIIRTSGEQRMSGFLPWQGIYAEYYFTDTLMPDFDENELKKAIEEYQKRDRRRGK